MHIRAPHTPVHQASYPLSIVLADLSISSPFCTMRSSLALAASALAGSATAHTIFQELYVNGVSAGHEVGIRVPTCKPSLPPTPPSPHVHLQEHISLTAAMQMTARSRTSRPTMSFATVASTHTRRRCRLKSSLCQPAHRLPPSGMCPPPTTHHPISTHI